MVRRFEMVTVEVIAEIRMLLALKTHSQRHIARLLGVSRGTVAAIASGRRQETPQETPLPEPCDDDTDDTEEQSDPPMRCPGCGGLVYIPCLLCRLRERRARRIVRDVFEGLLALDLRPDHRERYEQVRALRRLAAAGQVANLPGQIHPVWRRAPRHGLLASDY
jgi:transcriptional regulator with XRE-family HTH domain